MGADGVELDVHTTSDGVQLVHHDADLPGYGPLATRTWNELQESRLPNGEPVPTLAESLQILQGLTVHVEVKMLSPEYDARLLAVLDAGPEPDRYRVHSFDHRIVARLGELRPSLPRGILLASRPLDPLRLLRECGGTTLWQEHHLVDTLLVESVKASGGEVIAWTVNDGVTAQRLALAGVAGLCGNFPDRLQPPI